MRPKLKKLMWMAPFGIVGIAVFTFLGGSVVQYLWNWLLPTLFGWREVTFWQALGLLALCRILFGGLRLGADRRRDHFTPEERERFRHGIRRRFGFDPAANDQSVQL
ncbi:MAG TPA: hypothetical protein VH679_09275 [Vicinamibacterales bacterium]|jgi:hypothetical protein